MNNNNDNDNNFAFTDEETKIEMHDIQNSITNKLIREHTDLDENYMSRYIGKTNANIVCFKKKTNMLENKFRLLSTILRH